VLTPYLSRRGLIGAALYAAYFMAFAIYMEVFLRFPARVATPMLLISTVALVFVAIAARRAAARGRGWPTLAAALGLVLCAAFAWYQIEKFSVRADNNRALAGVLHESLAACHELDAQILLVQPGKGGVSREYMDPLRVYAPLPASIPLGWPIFSPRYYARLEEAGFVNGRDLLLSLVNNEDAYVVGRPWWIGSLTRYLQEEVGESCRAIVVGRLPNQSNLYQFRVKGSDELSSR